MSEEYLKILEKALEGIELTEEENRLVEWIAGWDLWTVRQFRQIIKKCRESDNFDLKEEGHDRCGGNPETEGQGSPV